MKSKDIRIGLAIVGVLSVLSVATDFRDPKTYFAAALAGVTAWLSPSKLGAKN
jgi:hypothetical protein